MASSRFLPNLLSQRPTWVPLALILLLWLWAGILAAQLFWQAWAPARAVVSPSALKENTATPRPAAQAVIAAHLFGEAANSTSAAAIEASTLNLPLLGILSGSPQPLVMLGVGGTVKVLGVGDTVQPGVTIDAIEATRVLLRHNGRIEALGFPPAPSLDAAPAPSATALQPATAAPRTPAPTTAPPPAAIRRQVQQVLKHPQSLGSLVRISPVEQGGAISGYALAPVPGQEAFLQALGLHPGDVITAVDGLPLNNPATLPTILPKLDSGQPMTLLIERGGQPMSVSINLDTLQ